MSDDNILSFRRKRSSQSADAAQNPDYGWVPKVEEHMRMAVAVNAIDQPALAELVGVHPVATQHEALAYLQSMEGHLRHAAETIGAAVVRLKALLETDTKL